MNSHPSAQSGVLRVACAWCSTMIRDGGEPPSHGICVGCFENFPMDDTSLKRLDADVCLAYLDSAAG